jgi:hypothetical protein
MTKISECPVCHEALTLDDIAKTQTVRSQYTAVSYACPECKHAYNEVYQTEIFVKTIKAVQNKGEELDLVLKVFAFDLECVNDVETFMQYASVGAAPKENPTRKCGCATCEKRHGG